MSNYTKSTNFATKDNLTPGDPLKIVRGTEIDTEYNNIATAIATKTDNASAAITGGTINNTTIGATTASTGAFTTLSATGVATFSAGTAAAPAITTTGDTNTGIFFPAADTIAFAEGGAEVARFDSSGNLGIGTSSPSEKLTVANSVTGTPIIRLSGFNDSNNSNYSVIQFYNEDASGQGPNIAASIKALTTSNSNGSGGQIAFSTSTGTGTAGVEASETMRLDGSGNLGLGTTTATGQASDNRVIQIFGAGTNNRAQIHLCNSDTGQTSTDGSFIGVDTTGALYFVNRENAATIFENNGSERARIDPSGNLLVGQTAVGFSNTDSVYISPSIGSFVGQHASGTASGTGYAIFTYSGGQIGSITQNGTTAVAYNTSSDYRLKNTIAPMTGALAKVAQLKPVTYKWNADGSDGQGFIAHELAEVCPDAVTGEKDAVDAQGNPQYQGIDVSFLVATLTAAIQELKAEFDAYKASHP